MNKVISILFLGLLLLLTVSVHAQPKDQMGVIELKQATKSKNPFKKSQDKAISYFKKLGGHLELLANGKTIKAPPPSSDIINHLTGVYLYCVKRKGVCPSILDAILEIDIINQKYMLNLLARQCLGFGKNGWLMTWKSVKNIW